MTAMTSRRIVQRTLEFSQPTRIPKQLWFLPWAEKRYPDDLARIRRAFPDDIVTALKIDRRGRDLTNPPERYALGTYVDEWGCVFDNAQSGIIGQVHRPLIGGWDELDKLKTPDGYIADIIPDLIEIGVDGLNSQIFCMGLEDLGRRFRGGSPSGARSTASISSAGRAPRTCPERSGTSTATSTPTEASSPSASSAPVPGRRTWRPCSGLGLKSTERANARLRRASAEARRSG